MRQGRAWRCTACHVLLLASFAFLTPPVWPQSSQAAAPQSNPSEVTLNLDPGKSNLHWTLGSTLHTVHGTFSMKSGVVRFDPSTGSAGGEFVVYAASGESGNDSRDKKMHGEILESSHYPEVIFRPTKIDGKVAMQGTSEVQLQGKFLLHGAEHDLTVPVHAELTGDHWKGSAKFTVPYIQWGLKSPSSFLLKADPAVEIELELNGTLQKTGLR